MRFDVARCTKLNCVYLLLLHLFLVLPAALTSHRDPIAAVELRKSDLVHGRTNNLFIPVRLICFMFTLTTSLCVSCAEIQFEYKMYDRDRARRRGQRKKSSYLCKRAA